MTTTTPLATGSTTTDNRPARLDKLDRFGLPPDVVRTAGLLALAVVAGVALGVGDLWAQTHVPYPWADLANSSAVWAVAAFWFGVVVRADPARSALAGTVLLVVAVEAYYAWAAVTGLGDGATLWSSVARMWVVFAVIAGVVFGVAGAWTHATVLWQRVLGVAAGAGVLVGEALHLVLPLGSGYVGAMRVGAAMTSLALLTVLVTGRRPLVVVLGALLTVPAAVFAAAAFAAVGIGY